LGRSIVSCRLPRRPKAVVFDMDGLLIAANPAFSAIPDCKN